MLRHPQTRRHAGTHDAHASHHVLYSVRTPRVSATSTDVSRWAPSQSGPTRGCSPRPRHYRTRDMLLLLLLLLWCCE